MKKTIKLILSDSFFKQSSIVFFSSVASNVFNLIFWLFMVRRLVPAEYGVVNSLVSVMAFFATPVSILQTVITRYVSKFEALKKREHISSLMWCFLKILLFFVGSIFLYFIFFSRNFSSFFHIESPQLVHLVAWGVILSCVYPIFLALLTGLQKFNEVALNTFVIGLAKVLGGVGFVLFGLKAYGAILGLVASSLIGLILSVWQTPAWFKRNLLASRNTRLHLGEIFTYFLPAGLGLVSFFALTNVDVILVKHFFSPEDAGLYSIAQMVGKIVLFVPGAIGIVMFPKITDLATKNEETFVLLKRCLFVVTILCGSVSFFAILFPHFILKLFTGHAQDVAAGLVPYFAISMSFFALTQILYLYHLSLHRNQYIYLMAGLAGLQFLLICFFHASFLSVLIILVAVSIATFSLGLLTARRA